MSDDRPIERIRSIATALEGGELPSADDRAWFAAALRQYESEAPNGSTLDHQLGLVPMPGQEAWWTVEARERRDRAIRTIAANFCADLGITRAARQIAKDGRDYQASTWRHDRNRADRQGAITDAKKRLLTEALATGLPFPGARHIENILRNESEAFISRLLIAC